MQNAKLKPLKIVGIGLALGVGLTSAVALAERPLQLAQSHQGHGGHAGHAAPAKQQGAAAASASTQAFEAVNEKMHKDMAIQFSGNTDVDFVRGMIPHHQGAIEMAEVVLKHGKSAEVKRLARTIIREQKKEIAWMQQWLAKNAK